MPLNQAQLMATPGGIGSIGGYPGAVKSGTGIQITSDGTISVDPTTNVTKLLAGSGISLTPTNGFGQVTISASGAGVSKITGSTYITVTPSTGLGDVTLNTTGLLPLTGGTMTGRLNINMPTVTGGAGLLMLKGPGNFPPDTGINGTFFTAWYDPTNDCGLAIRFFDPDPVTPTGSDTSISNQLTATDDNLWLYASRQLRQNANVSGSVPVINVFTYGPIPLGGNSIAILNTAGQWLPNAPAPSQLFGPPVNFSLGLTEILSLTPQAFQISQNVTQNDGTVLGTTASSTIYGFTATDLAANFPAALEEVQILESGVTQTFVNPMTLVSALVNSVQTLSQQLDTLQTAFDAYVATHP